MYEAIKPRSRQIHDEAREKRRKDDDEPPKVSAAAQKPLQPPVLCLKDGVWKYVIIDGSVGHTYERIFIDYIDIRLTELTVEDPYLLEKHQSMKE